MRKGFTLVELLIVLAILSVTMAIIIPSFQQVPSMQISMAAKDTLRLLRYARNMALQTQQPITLSFSPGRIILTSEFDRSADMPPSASEESDASATAESDSGGVSVGSSGTAIKAGDIDTVGLTKTYDLVDFEFLGYDDTVTFGREAASGSPADFARRLPGKQPDNDDGLSFFSTEQTESQPFTVTVRANGTTRPFSIRVFERDSATEGGTFISFDFLCSGTIGDE